MAAPPKEPQFVKRELVHGFNVVKRGPLTDIVFWSEWVYDPSLGEHATEHVATVAVTMETSAFIRDANRACQCVPIDEREFIRFPGVPN